MMPTMTLTVKSSSYLTDQSSLASLVLVTLLHVLFFGFVFWQSVQVATPKVASLSVRMLPAATTVTEPQPAPKPPVPKPKVPEPKKAEVKRIKTDTPAPVMAEPKQTEPIKEEAPPPAASAQSDSSADVVSAPVVAPRFDAAYLNNPAPAYPMQSRRLNEAGRVLLRVQVSEAGNALHVQLHQSSGHSRLDQAALDAVKRWRFIPARRGDVAISEWVIVPITFNLTR